MEETIKTMGAVAGLLTATITLLFTYRFRPAKPRQTAGDPNTRPIRITGLAPWKSIEWPLDWGSERRRRRFYLVWRLGLLVGTSLLVWLVYESASQGDVASLGWAALQIPGIALGLFGIHRTVGGPWKTWSPAQQRAEVMLACSSLELAIGQSMRALATTGARLVRINEEEGFIEAAAGPFGWGVSGAQIVVNVSLATPKTFRIVIVSDEIRPDPYYFKKLHMRNVGRFIEQFIG
jgi:hypothetical protein